MSEPPDRYGPRVEEVSARFDALAPDEIHGWLTDLLPNTPGALVMDIGAGTGRDAAWMAGRGLQVVAVEPSAPMLDFARSVHPSPDIRWLSDSLPALAKVMRLGLAFELILLSDVWMFVTPPDRPRAFRKLITLLKPRGRIAFTLRMGPLATDRGMRPVGAAEIEALARAHGALVERVVDTPDLMGREGIRWTNVVVRLPDDGTGALPLLRHIILTDEKSSTYKLALLRVLCRIADGSAGYGRETEDGFVAIPLGLAGLYWIRLFKPLLAAGLPQSPANIGDGRQPTSPMPTARPSCRSAGAVATARGRARASTRTTCRVRRAPGSAASLARHATVRRLDRAGAHRRVVPADEALCGGAVSSPARGGSLCSHAVVRPTAGRGASPRSGRNRGSMRAAPYFHGCARAADEVEGRSGCRGVEGVG
jgi:SAM-dependent methyltransferase